VAPKPAKTLEPFTVVVRASELPKRILDRFPEPPTANARFVVTVEAEESESEKLESLRRELQEGLDDLAAGKVRDGKDVFAELKKRFPAR
jgi:predicted transcriptional regulator